MSKRSCPRISFSSCSRQQPGSMSIRRSAHTPYSSSSRRGVPPSTGSTNSTRLVAYGASPRGSIGLIHAARALALLRGRRYALPQDVAELAKDVLRHRIVLSYEALAEERTADEIVEAVLGAVQMPRIDLAREAA